MFLNELSVTEKGGLTDNICQQMPISFIQGSKSRIATLLPLPECAKTRTDLVHPNRTDLVNRRK